ncbi:MAG: glycosyl transferase [Jatrophihabitans sp.]|nr:glycosyl transferase [Jatrophihabitans sp.]
MVVLTTGERPQELRRALDSLRMQSEVEIEIVVIGNGSNPGVLGEGVRTVPLPENIGVPAARNLGARLTKAPLIFFLDDDAWAESPVVLRDAIELFSRRPRLGAMQTRITDVDGLTMRRWVPRVRIGDPASPGPAFTLAEGVTFVRRAAFEAAGGWADDFFYGHEGIELTWRLWDAGWDVHYAGDLVMHHPSTRPDRHSVFYRLNARNRVWLARRNLPVALIPIYVAAWMAVTVTRLARQPADLRVWCYGFVEGWKTSPGVRRPMRWRTVARLARLGHPPII